MVRGFRTKHDFVFDDSKSHFLSLHYYLSSHEKKHLSITPLMHYKKYLSAGDDAKLLLAMLPPNNVQLYIFGRSGDWEAFVKESTLDQVHTLTLWPGEEN
jgi:hypothetical protein